MGVQDQLMAVPMRVWLAERRFAAVLVPVVLVVYVGVFVLHHVMQVLVFMVLGQVQPHSGCHEPTGESQP